jgi:hypothetical protein
MKAGGSALREAGRADAQARRHQHRDDDRATTPEDVRHQKAEQPNRNLLVAMTRTPDTLWIGPVAR